VVCIAVASLTVITSFILASFFGNTDRLLSTTCGHDLCDIRIEVEGLIDPEEMKADLEAMPEVQKVLMSSDDKAMSFADSDMRILIDIYEDFALTNNIILTEGRLPEHDNEIAFTSQVKTVMGLNVGDTVTMEYGKIRRDFVITGIVNSVVNPQSGYMTESAFRTVEPSYVPDNYDIYLKDGADVNEFAALLTERYGREIADIANSEVTGDTYEERVRSAAEIKMAQEMIDHGVSYMEYTIQAGDTVISGSTNTMKIKSVTMIRSDCKDIIAQVSSSFYQISAALMAVAAIVVMIILSVLMESTIRKQYRDIGIMKGMGYTSRELMFQMAFRIVPSAVVAVFIGSFLSFMIVKILDMYIAKMSYSMAGVVITCIVILLFCFFCSFIGAKKIRKISVYELMTE
jgi:ABC-type antimicrobial peptide transport system permease subunit